MWAVIVPMMVVGCGVAVVPVAYRSASAPRDGERSRLPRYALMTREADKPGDADPQLEYVCSPCGYAIHAGSRDELFEKLALHERQWHGIPAMSVVEQKPEFAAWYPEPATSRRAA